MTSSGVTGGWDGKECGYVIRCSSQFLVYRLDAGGASKAPCTDSAHEYSISNIAIPTLRIISTTLHFLTILAS